MTDEADWNEVWSWWQLNIIIYPKSFEDYFPIWMNDEERRIIHGNKGGSRREEKLFLFDTRLFFLMCLKVLTIERFRDSLMLNLRIVMWNWKGFRGIGEEGMNYDEWIFRLTWRLLRFVPGVGDWFYFRCSIEELFLPIWMTPATKLFYVYEWRRRQRKWTCLVDTSLHIVFLEAPFPTWKGRIQGRCWCWYGSIWWDGFWGVWIGVDYGVSRV